MPFDEYMTRSPLPLPAVATNRSNSGDQHTLDHCPDEAGDVRSVHVVPSGDVITTPSVPLYPTATKRAKSGDQHTDCQV